MASMGFEVCIACLIVINCFLLGKGASTLIDLEALHVKHVKRIHLESIT